MIAGYLLLGITYGFAAAVQPGPFQSYLISQALSHGWRRALPAALAPLLSDGPIITLVLLVLSRVPPWLEMALQTAGGIFLLYLAWGAYQSWRNYGAVSAPAPVVQQTVLKAALVNLLNPAPYLAWSLVMGPLLLRGWREAPANGIAVWQESCCCSRPPAAWAPGWGGRWWASPSWRWPASGFMSCGWASAARQDGDKRDNSLVFLAEFY
jgi:threonine/homoserine/homoserine lactone efflux protein